MTIPARLFLLILCSLPLVGTAYANQQEDLKDLRKRIATVQRDLEKSSASRSEAADALRESETAISDSNRKLAVLAKKHRHADQKLSKLKAQQQKLNLNITQQQALLGKFLHQQYLGGNQEYLLLLLNDQNPNQIARNLQYYQYIARSRASLLTSLRADLAALEAVDIDTREQRSELAALRAEQAVQKKSLQTEKHAHQTVLKKISQQMHQQRREINRLHRDENRLALLVEKITDIIAKPKSKSLFSNDNLPDNRFDGSPFKQLKGKLSLPVKGEIINRFGTPRPDSTVEWRGLFLRTSSGQPVKAIASGQVVFADWLRGFGNLLIVDHGDSYMSLYANNETLHKEVGDILRGGDTIAAVGNSGGNQDFGLYFELRHKSKPFDPIKWMAIN